MRMKIALLSGLLLASMLSMAMIRPANANIEQILWQPPYVISNPGDFVVYKDGTTAALAVSVLNDYASGYKMNVSKVTINFYTMNKNKTLDLSASPHQLLYLNTEVFTVSFTASFAETGGFQQEYKVIVEWVNATTGPMKVVGYWQQWWYSFSPYFMFAVYSTAQADALSEMTQVEAYNSAYPYSSFSSIAGRQLAQKAYIEYSAGLDDYSDHGDYASAKTHFDTALTLYGQAIDAEKNYQTKSQDAYLNQSVNLGQSYLTTAKAAMAEANASQTEANAAMVTANSARASADAALTNAYGWMAFGVGWVLIGIGAIIYGLRKPKTAP